MVVQQHHKNKAGRCVKGHVRYDMRWMRVELFELDGWGRLPAVE